MFEGRGFHGVQMMGMLNALKTGDPTVDTLIAMCLPIVLTKVVNELGRRGNKDLWWSRLSFLSKRSYKRTISYRTNNNGPNVNQDEDSYNCFLIKAIKLYMHKHCQFDMEEVDLELMDPTSLAVCEQPAGSKNGQRHYINSNNNANTNSTSTFGMLQNCTILQKPVKEKWHQMGTFDGDQVHIWMSESSSGDDGGGGKKGGGNNPNDDNQASSSQSIAEILLKSNGPTSIDTFVNNAYSWYMSELKKEESDDRFLLDLRGFDGRGSHRFPVFGAYKLGDEKTFASLFSQPCKDLLKIVDQFQQKSGKYAVQGYPYKLGLLLHGPPGTGKTSLIKALAHYTNRHIVNVPLSRIQTNQELMTLFFNKKFTVTGKPKPVQLDFHQLIFVLEDIDASTEVVMRRDPRTAQEVSMSALKARRTNVGGQSIPSTATLPASVSATKPPSLTRTDDDDLNLTGLLNVLDGVVDTPGRIVIMTTNHPEVLDPALIRPGRIDKKLELGFMLVNDVIGMLEQTTARVDPGSSRAIGHGRRDGGCHARLAGKQENGGGTCELLFHHGGGVLLVHY
jgi:chaperone BCS1